MNYSCNFLTVITFSLISIFLIRILFLHRFIWLEEFTYLAVSRTKPSPPHDVSWKKIDLPGVGCRYDCFNFGKYVINAAWSMLTFGSKHCFAFLVFGENINQNRKTTNAKLLILNMTLRSNNEFRDNISRPILYLIDTIIFTEILITRTDVAFYI